MEIHYLGCIRFRVQGCRPMINNLPSFKSLRFRDSIRAYCSRTGSPDLVGFRVKEQGSRAQVR